MRVLSMNEAEQVPGGGFLDFLEGIVDYFSGSSSSNPVTCNTTTVATGNITTSTMTCSNGYAAQTVVTPTMFATTYFIPGSNASGSVNLGYGAASIGGSGSSTSAGTACTVTVINGKTTNTCVP